MEEGLTKKQLEDWLIIKVIARLVLSVVVRCWALSGAFVLTILLLYWLYGGFFAFVMLLFAITGVLYQAEDKLLFHTEQPSHSRIYVPSPAMFNLPFENVHIPSKDKTKINMMFIKHPGDRWQTVPTIMHLHGNAGNIGHRLENCMGLYKYLECNVLLVEYRGYGHSDGFPSENGLYMDAQAALEWLLKKPGLDKNKIIVFGRSLGGAVAIDLASRSQYGKSIAGLILENTFTSIPDVAKVIFNVRLLNCLPRFAYKNKFESIKKIRNVRTPCLLISGLQDALIPPAMMASLQQACGATFKRVISFPSGTHNDTWQCKGYYHHLNLFIDDVIFTLLKDKEGEVRPFSPSSPSSEEGESIKIHVV